MTSSKKERGKAFFDNWTYDIRQRRGRGQKISKFTGFFPS